MAEHTASQMSAQEMLHNSYDDRRCITRKETIGFMLYSASLEFNLNGQKELFRDSVLKISFNKQSIYNSIGGIWDCINDILIGQMVDKTRTRWGKFVPYMFFSGLPYAAISSVYWLLPVILSAGVLNNYDSIPKFICYMLFEVLMETVTTLQTVTKDGFDTEKYVLENTSLAGEFGHYLGKMENFYKNTEKSFENIIPDYVSGMTDTFAIESVKELFNPPEQFR